MDDPRTAASRFVGRDPEVALLSDVLDGSLAGRGRLVLVQGETGIGKSRLLEEVATRAGDRGLTVLWGRAVEGGGAYRPVAEALAGLGRAGVPVRTEALGPYAGALTRLLPDWAGAGTDTASLDADPAVVLGEALARLLIDVGHDGACLLLLEDLHWADGDTLDVLVYLASAVAELPLVVLVSARDDVTAPGLRRLGGSAGVLRLELQRLTHDDVLALATALHGPLVDEKTARLLVERSEGLPLLVEELLPAAASAAGDPATSMPPSFAALVHDRLAELSPEHRPVLTAAAVLGSLEPELLSEVTGAVETEVLAGLRVGTEARLLTATGSTLTWRHALTREAVSRTLLPPERASLARAAAAALLRRGGRDDEAAAVELLRQVGSSGEAVDLMLDLAERNRARGALHTAEELLAHVEETGLRPEATAVARVRLLTAAGRPEEALAAGSDALGSASGDAHGDLALQLARAAIRAGRWSEAAAYVELAARPDDPRSESVLADAGHGRGEIADAERHADRAVALADGLDRPDELCEALVIRAKLHRLTDLAAAAEEFRRAGQVAARHGLVAWRVEALSGLGSLELLTAERIATVSEARALAVTNGLLRHAAAADMLLVDHEVLVAGPVRAAPAARDLLALARTLDFAYAVGPAQHVLALADVVAGGREWPAQPDHEAVAPETRQLAQAVRGFGALLAHDLPSASAHLDRFAAPLLDYSAAAPLHHFGLWALLRTATGQDGDDARTRLQGLFAGRRLANRGLLAYAAAVAAGRSGEPDRAVALLEDGERLLASLPWLRGLARVVTLECAVTDGWGDPVPLLRLELAEQEELRQDGLARTCRDLLRRTGAPTRRGRGSSTVPDELRRLGVTSREMDVLLQVAEGASNAAVAERLFLSPRTVETHVASLLRKTGAPDRQALAGYVARDR